MITEDYQLHTLRARFAQRGYRPLNKRRRRTTPHPIPIHHWIGLCLIIISLLILITPIILISIL